MQKEFINIAAHEIRAPLQSIIWYSELLEIKPDQSKKYVDSIIRNAKILERLSQHILDITKIESSSLQLDKQHFNLDELLVSLIKDYQQLLARDNKTKHIQIIYNKSRQNKKDVIVYADKERVIQVISNLLENAIKFTDQGKITISIDNEDNKRNKDLDENANKNKVIVSVTDTGNGIH